MDVVLALLRTLVFVVATVAATVYIQRWVVKGRPLLWTGTTLLALYWLVEFGWSSYLAGTPTPNPDAAGWIAWIGYLLPFFAALGYIGAIGQGAGFPNRAAATPSAVQAGSAIGTGRPATPPAAARPATPERTTAPDPAPAPKPAGAGPNQGRNEPRSAGETISDGDLKH